MKTKKTIEQIARDDGRYHPEALRFVYEGLGFTIRSSVSENADGESRHISGQCLCTGLAKLAIQKWGRLARVVLNRWNVRTTRDFGEIVYLMIRYQWMSAQEKDSIEDFDNVFDFETVFEKHFRIII